MDDRGERGLWLVGMSWATRPARSAAWYASGSVPPTYQNTEGTPHSVPKEPKSSLAETGAVELADAVVAEVLAQGGRRRVGSAPGR